MELTIDTNLKGKEALDVCNSIIGQMSDGLWENSPAMNKYWMNCRFKMENDEVLLTVADSYIFSNRYSQKTNLDEETLAKKILSFFADKLKAICKVEEADNDYWGAKVKWDRKCEEESRYIHSYDSSNPHNPTISFCYQVYDVLKGREIDKNKY